MENTAVDALIADGDRNGNVDDQANEESGLITLKGCGHVTKWKFPQNQNNCPNGNCRESFDTRAECILHYERQHSMNAIVCKMCDHPISTHTTRDYIKHFERMHPNEAIPFDLSTQRNQPELSTDLINLSGAGFKTQWRFPPNQNRCPVVSCQQRSFESRSACLSHYKAVHAKFSINCCICEKPIVSNFKHYFERHYRRVHPDVRDPFDFDANEKLPKMIRQKRVKFTSH